MISILDAAAWFFAWRNGVYDGLAQPAGKYRSRLEREWANWFKLYGIRYEYIDAHWYDFKADEWFVEIKPHGQEYLEQAMTRMPNASTLVVIQGSLGGAIVWMCVRHGNVIEYERVYLWDLFDLKVKKIWQPTRSKKQKN